MTATVIDSPGLKFTLSKIRQLPNGVWRASALRTETGKKRKLRMDIEIVALAPDRLRFRAGNTQAEEFSFCRPSRLIG